MLTGRNMEALKHVADQCMQQSVECKVAIKTADVCDEAANKALVDETVKLYGKIDILVLCAGVSAH